MLCNRFKWIKALPQLRSIAEQQNSPFSKSYKTSVCIPNNQKSVGWINIEDIETKEYCGISSPCINQQSHLIGVPQISSPCQFPSGNAWRLGFTNSTASLYDPSVSNETGSVAPSMTTPLSTSCYDSLLTIMQPSIGELTIEDHILWGKKKKKKCPSITACPMPPPKRMPKQLEEENCCPTNLLSMLSDPKKKKDKMKASKCCPPPKKKKKKKKKKPKCCPPPKCPKKKKKKKKKKPKCCPPPPKCPKC